MDIDRFAYFLTISTFVAFAMNHDAIELPSDRVRVVELKALEDGTALVTLEGDVGTFLLRKRPDGSTMWTSRIVGHAWDHTLTSNAGKVAVLVGDGHDLSLAAYSLDGISLWTHALATADEDALPAIAHTIFAGDTAVVWSFHDDAFHVAGLDTATGALRWDHTTRQVGTSSLSGSGEVLLRNAGDEFLIDSHSGQIHSLGDAPEMEEQDQRVAGGYRWSYRRNDGRLDELAITATRLPPHPAMDASR